MSRSLTYETTIRLFSVISKTLAGGFLPLGRNAVGVFYSPQPLTADWALEKEAMIKRY